MLKISLYDALPDVENRNRYQVNNVKWYQPFGKGLVRVKSICEKDGKYYLSIKDYIGIFVVEVDYEYGEYAFEISEGMKERDIDLRPDLDFSKEYLQEISKKSALDMITEWTIGKPGEMLEEMKR